MASLAKAADQGGHGGHDDYEYSPYHYQYNVDDDKEYLHFGQEEENDGKDNVHGYYHVQLPDGRLQRVDYHVNGYSGYIADVKYDGEAHHPSHSHHGGQGDHGGHSGHHSSGHFGGSGRLGKAVSVESHASEEHQSSDQFNQHNVDHHELGHHSFGHDESGNLDNSRRLGKTLHARLDHREEQESVFKSDSFLKPRLGKVDPLFISESHNVPFTSFQDSLSNHKSSSKFGSEPQLSPTFGKEHFPSSSRHGKFLLDKLNPTDNNQTPFQFSERQEPLRTSSSTKIHAIPNNFFSTNQQDFNSGFKSVLSSENPRTVQNNNPGIEEQKTDRTASHNVDFISHKFPQLEHTQGSQIKAQKSLKEIPIVSNSQHSLPKLNQQAQKNDQIFQQNQFQFRNAHNKVTTFQEIQQEIQSLKNAPHQFQKMRHIQKERKEKEFLQFAPKPNQQIHHLKNIKQSLPKQMLMMMNQHNQQQAQNIPKQMVFHQDTNQGTVPKIDQRAQQEPLPKHIETPQMIPHDLKGAATVQKFVQTLPDGSSRTIVLDGNVPDKQNGFSDEQLIQHQTFF